MGPFPRSLNELSETAFNPKAIQFPGIPLEEYHICSIQQWRLGEIVLAVLLLLYGVFCPSFHPSRGIDQPPFIEDCAAFLVIAISARKQGLVHVAGVSTLLGNIVEGATIYFLMVFASQLLFIFFELLTAVGDLSADSFSPTHLITATHRNQSRRSQRCKSPPSNISIRLNLTTLSPTHRANAVYVSNLSSRAGSF